MSREWLRLRQPATLGHSAAPSFFLATSLLFGAAFTVITPPFQVPDEPVHLFRAFTVSEGYALPALGHPSPPQRIPQSISAQATLFTNRLTSSKKDRVRPQELAQALDAPLDPDRRVILSAGNTMGYSSLGYLPQAAGIGIGRVFSDSALMVLYAARLANVVVTSLLIWLAIVRARTSQWLLTLLALTPMALFMRASASPDPLTMAIAFLFLGLVIGVATAERTITKLDLAALLLTSFLIPLTKPVYAPLALAILVVPPSRSRNRNLAVFLPIVVLSAAILGTGTASLWARNVLAGVAGKSSVHASSQVDYAVHHPAETAVVIAQDYVTHLPRYLGHMIGRLGWLDTPLPLPILALYALTLLFLAVADRDRQPDWRIWQRMIFFIAGTLTLMLVSAALYASWTPVGADHVEGIQGRYLLPLSPLLLLPLSIRRFSASSGRCALIAAAVSLITLCTTLWVLVQRYYA